MNTEERRGVERYCTRKACAGDGCESRKPNGCPFEYVAADYEPEYRWKGEGPPPRSWMACGTLVYRSYSDYVG
jgi:hypothetical protein